MAWGTRRRLELAAQWGVVESSIGQYASEASRRLKAGDGELQQQALSGLEYILEAARDIGDAKALGVAERACSAILGHSRSHLPPSVEAAIGTIRYLVEHDPGALRHALRECQQLLTEALGSAELAERVTADAGTLYEVMQKDEAQNG